MRVSEKRFVCGRYFCVLSLHGLMGEDNFLGWGRDIVLKYLLFMNSYDISGRSEFTRILRLGYI